MSINLRLGDCLERMGELADGSVDLILCDLPYQTTACRWDKLIPFEPLWVHYRRLLKPRGAVVLTASQPFTTDLINSNRAWFKYCWVWLKATKNGWQHAKNKPMQATEDVVVFSPGAMAHASLNGRRMTYNPQGVVPCGRKTIKAGKHGRILGARPNQVGREYTAFSGYPSNVLEFANIRGTDAIHPTQKPVALMEYLIRTYSNEGDTVLDNCFGSCTTGVACLNTGRNFIGIEKDPGYFAIAQSRIAEAQAAAPLFLAS